MKVVNSIIVFAAGESFAGKTKPTQDEHNEIEDNAFDCVHPKISAACDSDESSCPAYKPHRPAAAAPDSSDLAAWFRRETRSRTQGSLARADSPESIDEGTINTGDGEMSDQR